MKIVRIYLIIFILIPFYAKADFNWDKIGQNVGGSAFFVDRSTIKKTNSGKIFFYLLTDYSKPNKNVLSVTTYIEGNCDRYQWRFLKDIYYNEPMGNGDVLATINETGEWNFNVKGSIMETIMKYVCRF